MGVETSVLGYCVFLIGVEVLLGGTLCLFFLNMNIKMIKKHSCLVNGRS